MARIDGAATLRLRVRDHLADESPEVSVVRFPEPKLALGDFYAMMGQGDKALGAYEQVLAINPTVAREKIIEYYLDAKKPDEAERLQSH